jgi:TonB family protein
MVYGSVDGCIAVTSRGPAHAATFIRAQARKQKQMSKTDISLILRRLRLVRTVLVLLLALAVPALVRAQEATMDAAAARMADALSKSKQTHVVVFEFVGPDGKITALGERLADDFSQALSKSSRNLHVENRSHIAEIVSKEQYNPDVIHIPTFDITLAHNMKMKAFVSATISLQGHDVNVVVKSTGVKHDKTIVSLSFSLALTDEGAALLAKTIAEAPVPPYLDDDKKESPPHCISCPPANYSSDALQKKIEGTVILEAVVGMNGAISDIRVIKPMPYGLTAAAIQAVRSWRLSPATAQDGTPITIREVFEVTFHLF